MDAGAALIPAPDPPAALAAAGQVANAHASAIAAAGEAANRAAASALFADFRSRKSPQTLRRHDAALDLFARYLAAAGIPDEPAGSEFATNPAVWAGATWGLVAGFARWLLARGYAIGSVNGRLSTIKTYCRLAMQAGGSLDRGEYVAIGAV